MKAKTKHIKPSANFSAGSSAVAVPIWERKYFFDILIFTFSFLLYTNSIPNEYNLDDELVTINHRLTSKGISAIPEIFVSPYYQDASGYSYEYRPMVLASFAIEHDVFGDNPHWSHFWNVILYSLTCVLLFRVLRTLFQNYSPLIAIAITLLFVAHPAHTEVVCSIKNRDEILGLMFGLLSFVFSIRFVISKNKRELFFVFFSFLLAVTSKMTVVPFVVIIPIAILFFKRATLINSLVVAIILLTPTFYFIGVEGTFSKIIIVFAVLLIVIAVYVALNYRQILNEVIPIIKRTSLFFHRGLSNAKLSFLSAEEHAGNESAFPPFNFRLLFTFLFSLLTLYLYYNSLHGQYYRISILIPLCFFLLIWWGDITLSWCSEMMFYLCLVITYTFSYGKYDALNTDMINTFLFYQLFYGGRKSLLTAIVPLFIFVYSNILNGKGMDLITSPLLFLLKFKWIRYIVFVVFLVLQVLDYQNLFSGDVNRMFSNGGIILLFVVFVITMRNYKSSRLLIWVFPLAFFVLIFCSNRIQYRPFVFTQTVAQVSHTTNQLDISLFKEEKNRPIDYAEQCVPYPSSQSLRLGTSFEIALIYLGKVVVPYPLSFYYGYSYISPMLITQGIPMLSVFLYSLLFGLCFCLLWRRRLVSFGLMIYLSSVIVISNYFQPVPGMIADRFLLIPSIGWIIVLVTTLFFLFKLNFKEVKLISIPNGMVRYVFMFILVSYSLLTFSRNFQWKDYLALARHDVQYVSTSTQAHNLLGLRLMKSSYDSTNEATQLALRQEALGHFKKAIEIYPTFFNATFDIGRVYSILNIPDSALVYYEKAIQLNPSFVDAFSAAGDIYLQKGQLDSARIRYEKIIDAFPTQYVGYDKVSYMYFLQKEFDKSIALNKVAIEKIPSDPQAYISIAKAFYTQNKKDSSSFYLKKALTVSPGNVEATGLLQSLTVR